MFWTGHGASLLTFSFLYILNKTSSHSFSFSRLLPPIANVEAKSREKGDQDLCLAYTKREASSIQDTHTSRHTEANVKTGLGNVLGGSVGILRAR